MGTTIRFVLSLFVIWIVQIIWKLQNSVIMINIVSKISFHLVDLIQH